MARFAEILSSHVDDPPARTCDAIESLPVATQLARLPMPGAFVLHGDLLGDECQVDASQETAAAIAYLELRYGTQTGES